MQRESSSPSSLRWLFPLPLLLYHLKLPPNPKPQAQQLGSQVTEQQLPPQRQEPVPRLQVSSVWSP
jgi:hypothetical protein